MEDFSDFIEDMELLDFQLERKGVILGLMEIRIMLPPELIEC